MVSARRDTPPSERPRGLRYSWLGALVALSVAAIVGLGIWDESREAEDELRDFGREQGALASLIASWVAMQLDDVRSDALVAARVGGPPEVLMRRYELLRVVSTSEPRPAEGPGRVVVSVPAGDGQRVDVVVRTAHLLAGAVPGDATDLVLLRPPGARVFVSASGAPVECHPLRDALVQGRSSTRLTMQQAEELHLPARTALAGTAWAGAGDLGRWGVVVVASAGAERDRHARARWRLVIGVVLAGGLVLAFGAYALRSQRKELELLRELTAAEREQQRDEQLEREGRAATMLTLAAGVAHEISTPLSVIHGRAEQLLEHATDERDSRVLQRIIEQAARIEGVIRGFLKLARGDAPTLEHLAPADVVREAANLVEHRFAKAGVALKAEQTASVPEVRGDRRLLEHALINLLLNACDACERGGSVRVGARHDPEGEVVVFEVDDDGEGMSEDLAAHVTEPFFSTKPPGQGTGLGLAIASEIVKIHRGVLAFTARTPRGTRATVRVPVAPGGADAHA